MGENQDGVEEELNEPEALVKDNRKGKMRSLELCVRLTSIFLNANIMLLLYTFLTLLCIPTEDKVGEVIIG